MKWTILASFELCILSAALACGWNDNSLASGLVCFSVLQAVFTLMLMIIWYIPG